MQKISGEGTPPPRPHPPLHLDLRALPPRNVVSGETLRLLVIHYCYKLVMVFCSYVYCTCRWNASQHAVKPDNTQNRDFCLTHLHSIPR